MTRLDHFLVQNNLVDSRNKAQQLIKEAKVQVNAQVIKKSSFKVSDEDKVVLDNEYVYVSRAAYKLKNFLPLLDINLEGMHALDIGASTGGFSEVLLLNNIQSVTCVDVGSAQLHEKLLHKDKVTSIENQDIRTYNPNKLFDLVTCDVSFISLHHILDAIDKLASGYIIILFKPQFEVGKDAKRDKNGVVSDTKLIHKMMLKFEDSCHILGWQKVLMQEASIKGKDGNTEYCYCFSK